MKWRSPSQHPVTLIRHPNRIWPLCIKRTLKNTFEGGASLHSGAEDHHSLCLSEGKHLDVEAGIVIEHNFVFLINPPGNYNLKGFGGIYNPQVQISDESWSHVKVSAVGAKSLQEIQTALNLSFLWLYYQPASAVNYIKLHKNTSQSISDPNELDRSSAQSLSLLGNQLLRSVWERFFTNTAECW